MAVLDRLLHGIKAGVLGGVALLGSLAVFSLLRRRAWWEVPNLLGSTFYPYRAFSGGPGQPALAGGALELTLAGLIGAVFRAGLWKCALPAQADPFRHADGARLVLSRKHFRMATFESMGGVVLAATGRGPLPCAIWSVSGPGRPAPAGSGGANGPSDAVNLLFRFCVGVSLPLGRLFPVLRSMKPQEEWERLE